MLFCWPSNSNCKMWVRYYKSRLFEDSCPIHLKWQCHCLNTSIAVNCYLTLVFYNYLIQLIYLLIYCILLWFATNKDSFSSSYMTNFYQTFIKMMAMWPAIEMSYQLTLNMLIKVTIYKNHISTLIWPISTKLSPKWCNWGWQQKHHISWPWKCRKRPHFTE